MKYSDKDLAEYNIGQLVKHLRNQGLPTSVIATALRDIAEVLCD